jgi:NTE family protein
MLSQSQVVIGDALRQVAVFASLSDAMRQRLVIRATPVRVRAGEWLFRAGDVGDSLYVVLSGRLEVVRESPGPAVLRALGRGQAFGELSLLTGGPRAASVRARRDSELLKLTREDFVELLQHVPDFGLALTQSLGEQLLDTGRAATPTPPAPSSIALVAVHAGSPASRLADELVRELSRWRTVVRLDPSDETGGRETVSSHGARFDRCEREAEQVLLVAESPQGDREWTDFCLRQADRVLALVDRDEVPAWLADRAALRGCDVVYCSPRPGRIDTEAWHGLLEPRATHWLWLDETFRAGARRIARRLASRSVGVVLSGGGARGLAHIGVLEELTAAGVVIDRVAGCSMGSFIGAQFAGGADANAIALRCEEELVHRNPWSDYTIPIVAATRGRKMRTMLARVFGSQQIQDLERAYFCVSADLINSELVSHDHGPVATAVGASMCIPGSAPALALDGRVLVDGGLFDNLPVEGMASLGEGPIIAVDVTAQAHPPVVTRRGRPGLLKLRDQLRRAVVGDDAPHPGLRETLFRSIVLASRDTTEAAKRYADLVINPETSSIGLTAFGELHRARELGRRAAWTALKASPALISPSARTQDL